MNEVEFPWPNEKTGYRLFSEYLENDPCVYFHGTSQEAAKAILQFGFRPTGELRSSSFASTSGAPLGYACSMRSPDGRGAVIAARFSDIGPPTHRLEGDVLYLDNPKRQPEIVAVCYVPKGYKHI